MKNKLSFETKTPYIPKVWASLVYLILFGIDSFLFAGRSIESIRISFLLELDEGFYSHVSNFSILLMVCLVLGYINIMITNKMKHSLLVALLLLVVNFVYELYIPILNTPDKIDAYYGFLGILLAVIYLILFQKYGLKKNPNYKEP